MRYRGRELDPIALWSNYVDIKEPNPNGEFLPLVFCPNPNHDNFHSPAFQINVERPLVHCFSGCGISGSYRHAIQLIEECSASKAEKIILKHLSDRGSLRRQRKEKKEIFLYKEDRDQYETYLPPDALVYLEERGISNDSVSRFKIGFIKEEQRIVIPAFDEKNRLQFLIKRAIYNSQWPKYLYSEGGERKNLLFGACLIDPGMIRSEGLVVVEGSLDAIRLHQHGLRNTVSILGSSISDRQRDLIYSLRPKRIYFMFDRDGAGATAILKGRYGFPKTPLYICRYPKGKFDPAELTRKEASRSIENAIPVSRFIRKLQAV